MKRARAALVIALAAACGGPQAPTACGPPDVTVVVLGAQRGRLAPCGCTSPQNGGFVRAAALVDELRSSRHDVQVVQVGGALAGTGDPQEEAKAEFLARAFKALAVDALHLGEADVAHARAFSGAGTQVRLPVNVTGDLDATPAEGRLGIVSSILLIGSAGAARLVAGQRARGATEPGRAVSRLRSPPAGVRLLAVDADEDELASVLASIPTPAVVVVLGALRSSPDGRVDLSGGPLVVGLPDRGRSAGIVELWQGPRGWLARYTVRPLTPDLDGGRGPAAAGVRAAERSYREAVRARGYLAAVPTRTHGPDEPYYVGTDRCATCHPAIHDHWAATPHAGALEALEAPDGVGHAWNPECVVCHTVGWERTVSGAWMRRSTGFASPEDPRGLAGVGCEACHGPGSAHGQRPRDPAAAILAKPGRAKCLTCHDPENSPGFAQRYEHHCLPRVDHRGVERTSPTTR